MATYILQCVHKATSTNQQIPMKQMSNAISMGAEKYNTEEIMNIPQK
jgi:hypothetical protein